MNIHWITQNILTLTTFSPLIGVAVVFILPRSQEKAIRIVSLLASLLPMALSLWLYQLFQGTGHFEWTQTIPWIEDFHIFYRVGVDGFSVPLIALTGLLTPIVFLSSWTSIQKSLKEYFIFFFLLEMGVFGVFVALDIFLFYVFWEVMLIPMYFIIGLWGGPRRLYASIKFVLFTMVGSLLMLAAILYLYYAGGQTFNIQELYGLALPLEVQKLLFLAFALAFAIKVPLFPFHTWLPDAHVEAPTGGSVILAAILLKMGTYGFLRYAMPLFPNAVQAFLPHILTLSVIGILYGALVSMVQADIKKLVAFSSVSHLGFVMLGLFALTPQSVQGANLQIINHGISTGALFLLVGMIYERRHTRMIADFGGIASVQPWFATLFLIVTLSSIGLPGTNGFVGEFLILLGTFRTHPSYAVLATSGVIFAAIYMLWMVKRVFFGPLDKEDNKKLTDINWREIGLLLPLIVLIFLIGFYPRFILHKTETTVLKFIDQVHHTQEKVVQNYGAAH
ncbi:MAG: NADH dehydrogenase [Deltaproteobacteria bacterium RIFCSPLOWO2_02_FULL_50_16]|nr:MAG: NADH dehydrogenase [Deltaproteobacteria bacterium GWA2_50_8]OGQ27501.1 MAG: NADH dehydrogenase [Deltaproteobacteria bacterium RIFCSPHIGHO2_02_FULL_50_15]OGQ58203.1 MAG: NADH dehydrogenase [Deltaproteobacteria bacterium RIFCSPLOWO2_02_FULL_50_16]OGQ65972.1 MAG: NADH dehydrogenase [Deltaproteobacteria bacterium RIFCSPLOWO2_12_FULL_50_11]